MERIDSGLYKVHVGCGKNYSDGWVNTDIGSHKKDLHWDLLEKSPFEDESCDFIFCEHVIEHFRFDEGIKILQEFKRILKKNGVARITTIDLDSVLSTEMTPEFIQEFGTKYSAKFKYRSQIFNRIYYGYGHKCIFDASLLRLSAYRASFKFRDMVVLSGNQTQYPDVFNIDRRVYGATTMFQNLVLEVTK